MHEQQRIHFLFFSFRCFINLFTDEAVLNIIVQVSGFTKLIFMRWKIRNPMSSPIPEHENSRFWLFRDKFVIAEAVLNIIVQATAFARVFFLHKGLKNQRAIGYLKIVFFWTTLVHTISVLNINMNIRYEKKKLCTSVASLIYITMLQVQDWELHEISINRNWKHKLLHLLN